MVKNFSTYLSKQIAEHLVVAELGRRGIIATPFAGNVPDIDIIAMLGGRTTCLQVKAIRSGEWSFQAGQYLDVSFENERQQVKGSRSGIDRDLICVFVRLGEHAGDDRFYLLRQGELQDLILTKYSAFIARRDGIRARNRQSTHTAVKESEVVHCLGRWNLITQTLT